MEASLLTTPAPGSAPRWQLSAPESYLLLHGPRANSVEAFRKGLLELVARGVLTVTTFTFRRLFWFERRESVVRSGPTGPTAIQAAPPLRWIYDLYRYAESRSSSGVPHVRDLGRTARKLEVPLSSYAQEVVIPSLLKRGLLRSEEHRVLGLFYGASLVETPRGTAERARLEDLMGMAERDLADAVARDPKQALALVGTLGAAILLMDPLFPELARLGEMLNAGIGDALAIGSVELRLSSDLDLGAFDLDLGSLDSLGGAFDALSDLGDGGDGGGGDGGDGGGGD